MQRIGNRWNPVKCAEKPPKTRRRNGRQRRRAVASQPSGQWGRLATGSPSATAIGDRIAVGRVSAANEADEIEQQKQKKNSDSNESTGFCRVLLGFTGFYMGLKGNTGL